MIAILVTRPGGESDPLVHALRRRGYRVHAVATVQTEPMDFNAGSLASCDWIVLTSVRGVKALAELPPGPRFAAVGSETARALRARGITPSHLPGRADGADLGDTLPDVKGKRIALVRASAASTDLPDRLRRRGATVEEVTAYRTVEGPRASAEKLRDALADPELAAVLFASGSAVRGFLDLGGSSAAARHHDRAAHDEQRARARLRGHSGGRRPKRVRPCRRRRPRFADGGQEPCVS